MLRFLTVLGLLLSIINSASAVQYKSPYQLISTKDGEKVYVMNHEGNEVAVLSTADDTLVATFPTGVQPNGMVLSPDEKTLYLGTGGYNGKIEVLNLESGKVEKEVPGGHTPCGLSIAPDGKMLYVCNRYTDDISEYQLPGLEKGRTFKAIREPRGSVVTPDGKTVLVINFLPNDPADSFDVASEVTTIDTASGEVKNIRLPNGSSSLHAICLSPDGKYAYLTEILARYQMPTTQLERGWINTNAISVIDTEKKELVNTVLIDDVDLGAANPYGIVVSEDGKELYVAISGTHELCVINTEGMLKKLLSLPKTAEEAKAAGAYDNRGTYSSATVNDVPNDLAFLVGLKKRIKLKGNGPRGLAVAKNRVYLGMYFTDTLDRVDFSGPGVPKISTVTLGPEQEMTAERKGERNWNDASLCFQSWHSCASCHPDARVDALNWDLLNDGLGNPKNAKSMLLGPQTPPAMWEGVRKTTSFAVRTGFRYILMSVPNEQICNDIDAYIAAMQPLESPRLVDGKLSEAAQRGQQLFESKRLNCIECHPAPLFTDLKMHNVNSKASFDRREDFDTPSLVEVWRSAPFMHDGRFVNIRDVFAVGKHGDVNGDIESLSEEELNDLVEYVLSL
ncbi:MAG: hypothetical protein ACRC10_04800 [Thermoguttaceae bacterium]